MVNVSFLSYWVFFSSPSFHLYQKNVYGFRAVAKAAGKTLAFGGDEEGNNAQ